MGKLQTAPCRRADQRPAPIPPPVVAAVGARAFVWGAWALALLAALAFIQTYGRNIPYSDEWELVPVLTGQEPITAGWFWAQHNEHRIPLARLILLGLYRLTGSDFRAGMFWNGFGLGALAFAMIVAASRVRGWTSYSDAFFPLVLIHWGHYENLLWSWEVAVISSTIVAGVFLVAIAEWGTRAGSGTAWLAAIGLVLLPLCGAFGLALTPALALWLGSCGLIHRGRAPCQDRWPGGWLLASACASLLLVGLYFIGYRSPPPHRASPGVGAALRTSLEFFSMSFGPVLRSFWPVWGLGVVGLLLVSTLLLVRTWSDRPGDRPRTMGLGLFMAAIACLAFGLGWGRAGLGPAAGFAPRYVSLAVLAPCWVYFVGGISSSPRLGRCVQMFLLTITLILFPINASAGMNYGRYYRHTMESFERDLRAGVPQFMLAERYAEFPFRVYPYKECFAEFLGMLHRAGIGPFRSMRGDPAFREVVVTGDTLKKPQCVYAIRLKYFYTSATHPTAFFKVFWKNSRENGLFQTEPNVHLLKSAGHEEKTVMVWVNSVMDSFSIFTYRNVEMRNLQMTLLVPVTDWEGTRGSIGQP